MAKLLSCLLYTVHSFIPTTDTDRHTHKYTQTHSYTGHRYIHIVTYKDTHKYSHTDPDTQTHTHIRVVMHTGLLGLRNELFYGICLKPHPWFKTRLLEISSEFGKEKM